MIMRFCLRKCSPLTEEIIEWGEGQIMLGIECPYCGTIYKTEIHEIDPETEFTDEQCPNCEKFYAFEYYLQPTLLNVRKLEEE